MSSRGRKTLKVDDKNKITQTWRLLGQGQEFIVIQVFIIKTHHSLCFSDSTQNKLLLKKTKEKPEKTKINKEKKNPIIKKKPS